MNPLLVVLPYHNGDYDLALNLVKWIAELGPCHPHSILCAADNTVPMEKIQALQAITKQNFTYARTMLIPVPNGTLEKPVWKPNEMFLAAARQVKANYKLPFLWLEPDCVPLQSDWLDSLADDYSRCPMQFMGPIIHQEGQPGLPADHLTGCSVYPNNAIDIIGKVESVRNGSQAWDIGAASAVIGRSMHTDLIHHYWGQKDLPPIFVEARRADDPKNFVPIAFIGAKAVMFHRSKDGALINLLRKARKPIAEQILEETGAEEELPQGSSAMV